MHVLMASIYERYCPPHACIRLFLILGCLQMRKHFAFGSNDGGRAYIAAHRAYSIYIPGILVYYCLYHKGHAAAAAAHQLFC